MMPKPIYSVNFHCLCLTSSSVSFHRRIFCVQVKVCLHPRTLHSQNILQKRQKRKKNLKTWTFQKKLRIHTYPDTPTQKSTVFVLWGLTLSNSLWKRWMKLSQVELGKLERLFWNVCLYFLIYETFCGRKAEREESVTETTFIQFNSITK